MSGPLLGARTQASLIGVCILGALYVFGAGVGWPLGRVALGGAVLLTLLDVVLAGWKPRQRIHDLPFGLLGLVVGLLLLVGGAEQANLFVPLVGAVDALSATGASALPGLVIGMALLANITNNLPAALVAASALGSLPVGADRANVVAAMIVGVNLGPNLTTVGSLATMLWLVLLRRRGLEVSAVEYVRVGGLVTVPALLLGSAALLITAAVVHG